MSTSNDDDQLEKTLAHTLNRSLDAIDGDISRQILLARQQAMAPSRNWKRRALGVAIAASIAALAVVPLINHNTAPQSQLAMTVDKENGVEKLKGADKVKGSDALAPDPQMPDPQMIAELDILADMDMIDAMGEVTTESTNENTHAGKS